MEEMARWQPAHVLGSGAFGQVYLAWDTVEQRYVAVKHFTGQDELDLLRFVIESRIRVNHPHLVRTVAFRLVDDEAWLVTELARGGSLRPLLNRGPQPLGWVVEVIDQTLDALGALHASGVVHRDVKPANILLRDSGMTAPYVLVGDFGIAAWRTVSMTGVGAAIGTLGYLAPEYLNGTQPSPQTDLFAVGVLAAELLNGRRLIHQSNSTPDLPSNWHDDLVPLPDGIPGHLTNVLRRMADPDPSRRYADCVAALEALRYASPPSTRQDLTSVEAPDLLVSVPAPAPVPAPTQPVSAPIPVPLPSPAPPPAKRRFPWMIVSGAAVLTAAAVGLVLWLGNEKSPSNDPASGPGKQTNAPVVAWTPEPLETCSRVDIGRLRQNDTQRCQRTSATAQSWVTAPPGGFPTPSNPSGPFAGEPCTSESTQDYSPAGARLTCRAGAWQA